MFVSSLSYIPKAQTSSGERAATLRSWFSASPVVLGFGLGTSVQLVPSQCSTNVTVAPDEARCDPTAQAFVGEIAVTASRLLPRAGCGVETMLQFVPFQCSTRLEFGAAPPTAQTSFGPAALTELR